MISYGAAVFKFTELFKRAVEKSDGIKLDMLSHLDIDVLEASCHIYPRDEYPLHREMLHKLLYTGNWKHSVHRDILRTHGREDQYGYVYYESGKDIPSVGEKRYCSFLVVKPHEKYLFVKLLYNTCNKCIDTVYAIYVTQLDLDTYNIVTTEGNISFILEHLLEF